MAIQVYIKIYRSRVFDEVYKKTAYIGDKAKSAQDPDAYSRIAATEANDEQLEIFFSEACAAAKQALGHWMDYTNHQAVPSSAGSTDFIHVQLTLPYNWISALQSAVEEQLLSHLVNAVLWRWLMLTKKEEAQAYAALSEDAMLRINQLLLMRRRPARRTAPSGGDDEPTTDGLWHDNEVWLDAANWQENN